MPGLAVSVSVDGPDSGGEQLGLGGGEFVVGQDALLVQRRQLVKLVEHGRRLGRGRGRRRRLLLLRRLLFQIADALVLVRVLLSLLLLAPGHMLACHVRATANRRRTQL